jgi:hypothetical protein
MKINELGFSAQFNAHGFWVADWSRTGECDYSNVADVIRTHRPVLQFDLLQVLRPQLTEATYRDLMARIDPGFLQQGLRVQDTYILPQDGKSYHGPKLLRGISYQGFQGDTMKFMVTPSTEYPERSKPSYYENLIKFMNWDDIGGDPNTTPREKASLLLWTSDVQLHCSDPSFLYWGYQYILTQLNAAMVPESRPPIHNNPSLRGVVCKHLNRVLHVLPFYNADMTKAITDQWGGKIDKRALDAIRRRADMQKAMNEQNTELPPEADIPEEPQDPQEQLPQEEVPPVPEINPDETTTTIRPTL